MANQGCVVFNTYPFEALISQINSLQPSLGTPAEIQQRFQIMVDEALNPLLGVQASIASQLSLLAPLLSIPSDLSSVIGWITNYINASIVVPNANLLLQQAAMVTQLGLVTAAIEAKAAALGVSIIIPTLPHC